MVKEQQKSNKPRKPNYPIIADQLNKMPNYYMDYNSTRKYLLQYIKEEREHSNNKKETKSNGKIHIDTKYPEWYIPTGDGIQGNLYFVSEGLYFANIPQQTYGFDFFLAISTKRAIQACDPAVTKLSNSSSVKLSYSP